MDFIHILQDYFTDTLDMHAITQDAGEANLKDHYNDVIMSVMASQITGILIIYSTVCSGPDQRKHQSSASLDPVRGIHRWPVILCTKGHSIKISVFHGIYLSRSPCYFQARVPMIWLEKCRVGVKFGGSMMHVAWRPLLGSSVPCHAIKYLQLVWRSGARR